MQHRFEAGSAKGGSLDNHAMGNLLIVTLWELLGDTVAGLKWAGALLGARGQVLPMSSVPLTIEGKARVEPRTAAMNCGRFGGRPNVLWQGSWKKSGSCPSRSGLHRGPERDRAC
jgi:hypothetical protein